METMIRASLLLGFLFIIPSGIGMLYGNKKDGSVPGVLAAWSYGMITLFGVFQVVVIPCIFLERSLTFLLYLYVTILIILVVVTFFLNFKQMRGCVGKIWRKVKATPWITIVVLTVIVFQVWMYVGYRHTDDDDAFYVATGTTAVEENSLYQIDPSTGEDYNKFPARYVLSPFPIFIAVLSRLSDIHVAILAHTVLPALLLAFAYAVFSLNGYVIFKDNREKTGWFVLLIATMHMYLYSTVYTQASFMLIRIWQGKAVLTAALLPFLLYLGLKKINDKWKILDWVLLLMTMLACCMVSSMGIMLSAIMGGIIGILLAVLKKDGMFFLKTALCIIPNMIYMIIYILIR